MRIAILADIHGNLPAFEAALHHLSNQKPDQVIISGDVIIGSPDSAECWRLARSLGYPMLRGNHERYAAHFGTPQASPEWSTAKFAPLQYAVAQFTEADRQAMAALPLTLRLPAAPGLLFVHASPRDDHDSLTAHTPDERVAAMFGMAPERWIIRSHNHVGAVRLWGDRLIITCGSVGLPLDGHLTAQYLLLDRQDSRWEIRHQSVPYDLEKTLQRFRDTDYLRTTGPMGRLFLRELVTATQQIDSFLRLYGQWTKEAPLSLDQAVERFLNGF